MSTTAEKLIAERKRRGLSQVEAAAEIGVPQPTVSRWENGDEPRGLYQSALLDWLSASSLKPAAPAEQGAA